MKNIYVTFLVGLDMLSITNNNDGIFYLRD